MSLVRPSSFDWRPFARIMAEAYGLKPTDDEIEREAKRIGAQMDDAASKIERCLTGMEVQR